MRFTLAHLLLLGAAFAAPVEDRSIQRSEEAVQDNFITRGLIPILPRVAARPLRPAKPVQPGGSSAPVRPEPEPLTPGTSPDAPSRGPDSPDPATGPLRPEAAPQGPKSGRPANACGSKRAPCRKGADASLGIDANYERGFVRLESTKIPKEPYIKAAGLDPDNSQWFKTTIGNGVDTRARFDEEIFPEYEKKYNPANNKNSAFNEDNYGWFVGSERLMFGPGSNSQPFIQTKNEHTGGTMVVEQMFKDLDLFNGCKDCKFLDEIPFERPALPRKEGVKELFPSQALTDNWRVSAAEARTDTNKINNFAMNNVATPASQTTFGRLFRPDETDKTFKRGEPGFDQIEGTVQAKIINRMLNTEKPTYGNKQIAEHWIFRDGNTWHMNSKTEEIKV